MVFVSVIELTVGLVPDPFNERKFPDPVPVAVIPIDAEGEERVPDSGL
jgi:hypothetical protein